MKWILILSLYTEDLLEVSNKYLSEQECIIAGQIIKYQLRDTGTISYVCMPIPGDH